MRESCSGGDARPGVADLDDRACRRRCASTIGQPAALRHRVARVEEQIQEHLLQLVFDALHDQRRGG